MENIDINKSRKIYNEINNISQNSQQNKDEDNNMNNNSKRGINNKKYEDFDLNKNYFLACPNCKHILPFCRWFFHFVCCFLCCAKSFEFKQAHLVISIAIILGDR